MKADIYHDGYGFAVIIDGGFVGRAKTYLDAVALARDYFDA